MLRFQTIKWRDVKWRAWHCLHVFPRLARVTFFPPLGTGYMFSCAWHCLHVFPRLARVTCSLALGMGYMTLISPLLTRVACFPALGTGYTFLRAWHGLHVFSPLAPVAFYNIVYVFSPFLHHLHVFLSVACFQRITHARFKFSRRWHRLQVLASCSPWFFACHPCCDWSDFYHFGFGFKAIIIQMLSIDNIFNTYTLVDEKINKADSGGIGALSISSVDAPLAASLLSKIINTQIKQKKTRLKGKQREWHNGGTNKTYCRGQVSILQLRCVRLTGPQCRYEMLSAGRMGVKKGFYIYIYIYHNRDKL